MSYKEKYLTEMAVGGVEGITVKGDERRGELLANKVRLLVGLGGLIKNGTCTD